MFPKPDTCTSYFILKCFIFTLWYMYLKYMKKVWQRRFFFWRRLHRRRDITWQSRHRLTLFFNKSTCLLLIPLYSEIMQILEVKDRAQPLFSVTRFVFQEEVCFFLKYKHSGMHNIKLTTLCWTCAAVLKCLPERCQKQVELRGNQVWAIGLMLQYCQSMVLQIIILLFRPFS